MNNMKVTFPYYTTVELQPHVLSKCCVLEDIACPYIFVQHNILKCWSVEDPSGFCVSCKPLYRWGCCVM